MGGFFIRCDDVGGSVTPGSLIAESSTGASVAVSAVTLPKKMTWPVFQPRPQSPPGRLQVQPANTVCPNPSASIAPRINRASISTSVPYKLTGAQITRVKKDFPYKVQLNLPLEDSW